MAEPPPTAEHAAAAIAARPVSARRPAALALELPGTRLRDACLDLLLILVVAVIVPFAPSLFTMLTIDRALLPEFGGLVVAGKWVDVLLVGAVALYLLLRGGLPAEAFGIRASGLGRQTLWGAGTLVGAYVYMAGSSVVILSLLAAFPELQHELWERVRFVRKLPQGLGVQLLLLLPVALHEELLFRGMLLPYLRRVGGRWWLAIAISSLLFGGLHFAQGAIGMLQIMGLGAVLAGCFVLSRSLLAVTLAHLAFDLLQFQIIRALPDLENLAPQALGG